MKDFDHCRFSTPGGIVALIADDLELSQLAAEMDWGHDTFSLVESLLRKTRPDDYEKVLRHLIGWAVKEAYDYERKRVRKNIKKGGFVKSIFSKLLTFEVAWNVHHEDGGLDPAIIKSFTPEMISDLGSILERWKTPNGKPLSQATAGYLRKVAEIERSAAEGHLRNAVFYERLAGDLPDDAVIGEHVSAVQAQAAGIHAFKPEMRAAA